MMAMQISADQLFGIILMYEELIRENLSTTSPKGRMKVAARIFLERARLKLCSNLMHDIHLVVHSSMLGYRRMRLFIENRSRKHEMTASILLQGNDIHSEIMDVSSGIWSGISNFPCRNAPSIISSLFLHYIRLL